MKTLKEIPTGDTGRNFSERSSKYDELLDGVLREVIVGVDVKGADFDILDGSFRNVLGGRAKQKGLSVRIRRSKSDPSKFYVQSGDAKDADEAPAKAKAGKTKAKAGKK